MRHPRLRLARPLYEGLPWLYMVCGLAALTASYRGVWPHVSVPLGLGGIVALLAGAVVWLRRREYRRMRTQYVRPDGLSGRDELAGSEEGPAE
jgi:hypothetical protein